MISLGYAPAHLHCAIIPILTVNCQIYDKCRKGNEILLLLPLCINYNGLSKLSLARVKNEPRKFTSLFMNVIYGQVERVYWSAVRRPVCPPHSEDWFHYLYSARRPPAPTGTMKVREDRNACGRQGCSVRWGGETRVPGSQARNASTSNKACSPPFTPFLPGPLEVPSQTRNFSWIFFT